MSIFEKLSSSLGRKDEVPNVELAKSIVERGDKIAIKELIGGLHHPSKVIQNDCIKVLYEIGGLQPQFIAPYLNDFLILLKSKRKRVEKIIRKLNQM